MGVSDRPIALAGVEQGVFCSLVGTPANLAFDLLTVFSLFMFVDYSTVNLYGFFFSEVVLFFISTSMPLLDRRVLSLSSICNSSLILSAEVLNCKFQSTQLNGISSSELVVLHIFVG